MRRISYIVMLLGGLLATATNLYAQEQEIQIESVQFAGQLAGIVLFGDDAPVKGVTVSEMSTDRRKLIKALVTDSLGKFDFGKAEKGIHVLRLQAPGYNMYWYRVRIDNKSKATLRLQISPAS